MNVFKSNQIKSLLFMAVVFVLALSDAKVIANAAPTIDQEKPTVTSGIRLGTPAGTTRGFGKDEFSQIGHLIGDVLDGLASNKTDNKIPAVTNIAIQAEKSRSAYINPSILFLALYVEVIDL